MLSFFASSIESKGVCCYSGFCMLYSRNDFILTKASLKSSHFLSATFSSFTRTKNAEKIGSKNAEHRYLYRIGILDAPGLISVLDFSTHSTIPALKCV